MKVVVEVGQQLYYVPAQKRWHGEPRWITVEKVGRKWITTSGTLRLSVETLEAEGGDYNSPGRAFVSVEAHEREVARQKTWITIRDKVSRVYHPPANLNLEALEHILRILDTDHC